MCVCATHFHHCSRTQRSLNRKLTPNLQSYSSLSCKRRLITLSFIVTMINHLPWVRTDQSHRTAITFSQYLSEQVGPFKLCSCLKLGFVWQNMKSETTKVTAHGWWRIKVEINPDVLLSLRMPKHTTGNWVIWVLPTFNMGQSSVLLAQNCQRVYPLIKHQLGPAAVFNCFSTQKRLKVTSLSLFALLYTAQLMLHLNAPIDLWTFCGSTGEYSAGKITNLSTGIAHVPPLREYLLLNFALGPNIPFLVPKMSKCWKFLQWKSTK